MQQIPKINSYDIDDVFCKLDGFIPFLWSKTIRNILAEGGFIAGGAPRHMLATGRYDEDHFFGAAHGMRASGGVGGVGMPDIDVFFPNEEAYIRCTQRMDELLSKADGMGKKHPGLSVSHAGFALNGTMERPDGGYGTCQLQFVNKYFGTPEEVLSDFDLHNSMVAFDFQRAYVAEGWKDLQKQRRLRIVRESNNELLGWRIEKYIMRYGYRRMDEENQQFVIDWFQKWFDQNGKRTREIVPADQLPHPGWGARGPKVDISRVCAVLREPELFSNENLYNFVGYFTEVRRQGSVGQNYHVDPFIEEMERRGMADRDIKTAQRMAKVRQAQTHAAQMQKNEQDLQDLIASFDDV